MLARRGFRTPPDRAGMTASLPSGIRVCRSPVLSANGTRAAHEARPPSDTHDCRWNERALLAQCCARGRWPGMSLFLRTSLTSSSRTRRMVSVGKQPASGRLPSRSRECRVRALCVAVRPIQRARDRCHQSWYCPFSCRRFRIRCENRRRMFGPYASIIYESSKESHPPGRICASWQEDETIVRRTDPRRCVTPATPTL
jgi:hypothetical protein